MPSSGLARLWLQHNDAHGSVAKSCCSGRAICHVMVDISPYFPHFLFCHLLLLTNVYRLRRTCIGLINLLDRFFMTMCK